MWFLGAGARPLAVGLALVVAMLAAVPSAAHPPEGSDHDVDPTTFYTLWSGDADDAEAAELEEIPAGSAGEMRVLASATDIPLDAPPVAAERWNRGDHREFPRTDGESSIHPHDVDLFDGRFVRDAYAAVFAVQPSTRARLSPNDQPLFVAPDGELLGTVDYRVELPAAAAEPNRTVEWSFVNHGIIETRLLVDGQTVSSGTGTHTPALPYWADDVGAPRTLTLEADIVAVAVVVTSTCGDYDVNNSTCREWDTSLDRQSETVTVRESIEVLPYELSVTGAWGRYPDGDLGLVLYRNQPWLGYSVPGGVVHGVWRFYSARNPRWDQLVSSTADGDTMQHSPMHPLQIHAYPFEPGPTASPSDAVTILETYGVRTDPPTLPGSIHLDVIEAPYTASYGIATRTDAAEAAGWEVRAAGLVSGEVIDIERGSLREVPIHETSLELAILDSTAESVTVRVELTDTMTGDSIETRGARGYVVLDGQRVETDAAGTATVTIPRPMGALSARYEPGPWWPESVSYVGDSDVFYVRGTILHALAVIYEIGVPVALFLFGVFVIDRITGWRVWPPWRRL